MKKLIFFIMIFCGTLLSSPKHLLVEMLTNSHCPVCPPAHSALKQYEQTSPNSGRVNFIFYHTSFPYPSDPLYQANTTDPTARNTYYGNTSSTPVTFFDGSVQDRTYSQYASRIDNLLSADSPFEINLSGVKNGNEFSVNAEVTRTGSVSASDLVIHFVVTEHVNYQGNNGVSPQPHVMRKMIGSPNGEALSITLNETKNISKNIAVQSNWIADSLTVVVFIQSAGSKQVYQSASIDYRNLSVTSVKNEGNIPKKFLLEQNYPNPFNPSTIISYQIPSDEFVSIKVFNLLGKEIARLVNEKKAAGRYEINFNGAGLSNGVYIYKITAGSFTETKKMILLK